MKEMYAVTVFDKVDLPENIDGYMFNALMINELETFRHNHFGDVWTCAILDNYDEAVAIVENNITDIQEGCYRYAIIETWTRGLYPHMTGYALYEWDGSHFIRCDVSPLLKVGFQGFALY